MMSTWFSREVTPMVSHGVISEQRMQEIVSRSNGLVEAARTNEDKTVEDTNAPPLQGPAHVEEDKEREENTANPEQTGGDTPAAADTSTATDTDKPTETSTNPM